MGQARRKPKSKGQVMIASCHPPDYAAAFGNSLSSFILWDSCNDQLFAGRGKGHLCMLESSPRIAATRNRIAHTFLASPCQWLWMLDADMVFQLDTLRRLMEHADPRTHPMVAGLYFLGGRGVMHTPALYEFGTTSDGTRTSVGIESFPENTLMQVDGTGGGCVLIHRSVFEQMLELYAATAYPFFADTELDHQEVGEDITFFMRAKAMGIPLYVHTGIVPLHEKRRYLGLNSWDELQKKLTTQTEGDLWDEYAAERGGRIG